MMFWSCFPWAGHLPGLQSWWPISFLLPKEGTHAHSFYSNPNLVEQRLTKAAADQHPGQKPVLITRLRAGVPDGFALS